MEAASKYFKKGLYENEVSGKVSTDGGSLKIGIRCSSMPSNFWVIYDNFRLHFFGELNPTGIQELHTNPASSQHIYSLDGRVVRTHTGSTDGLRPGLYIINGKKVVIK